MIGSAVIAAVGLGSRAVPISVCPTAPSRLPPFWLYERKTPVYSSIRSHVFAILAVLCLSLGSVGAARAASVRGGGTFFGCIPVAVSASGGPGAAQGILFLGLIFNTTLVGKVVDLHVVGNAAIVTSIVTQSTNPFSVAVNETLYLVVLDRGANGEFVGAIAIGGPYDSGLWSVLLTESLPGLPNPGNSLTHGHIFLTP